MPSQNSFHQRQRREVLQRALRAASALGFLQDEVITSSETEPSFALSPWKAAGLPSVIEAIASAVTSLELEGFNVAVPPALCPGSLPASHQWWRARPPLHANGRLHYC